MAASVNKSETIRRADSEYPGKQPVELGKIIKEKYGMNITPGLISTVRLNALKKGGVKASAALKKFKATRATQKRRGALPGGDPATAPFRTAFEVDERGVEIALRNGHGRIGTLEISPVGLVFVEGKGVRSTERCIPWNLLSSLQGFAAQTEGGD